MGRSFKPEFKNQDRFSVDDQVITFDRSGSLLLPIPYSYTVFVEFLTRYPTNNVSLLVALHVK